MLPAGKGEEQALAGTVLTLLCLQMGSGPEAEEVFRSLKPLLVSVLTDSTASPGARQSVRPSPFPPGCGGALWWWGEPTQYLWGPLQSQKGGRIGCCREQWGKAGALQPCFPLAGCWIWPGTSFSDCLFLTSLASVPRPWACVATLLLLTSR